MVRGEEFADLLLQRGDNGANLCQFSSHFFHLVFDSDSINNIVVVTMTGQLPQERRDRARAMTMVFAVS